MIQEPIIHTDSYPIHFVEPDIRERAIFSRLSIGLGHHCELYDDFDELFMHPPRAGIIMVKDAHFIGGVALTLDRLAKQGIWLPVIVFGNNPTPSRIVDAIKSGALDYVEMPFDPDRLKRSFARVLAEKDQASKKRRRQIEAKKQLEVLSAREAQVLEQLALGNSNKLIARELGISPRTVEIHRANMMSKLNADHAATAVRIKIEAEIL